MRQWSGWTDFQVKKHMQRLEALEYVLIHRGRRGQSFAYELLYQNEGGEGEAFVMGLVDAANLHGYDAKKEPRTANKEPARSPRVAPKSPQGDAPENVKSPEKTAAVYDPLPNTDVARLSASTRSHRNPTASPSAPATAKPRRSIEVASTRTGLMAARRATTSGWVVWWRRPGR